MDPNNDNGNVNVNVNNDDDNANINNAETAARIEQSQAGLQRIERALSRAERHGDGWEQELSDSVWQFLTTFSDESISQGNRHLLASDLIVEVLEEHKVRREANPNLRQVKVVLRKAFKNFFDDRDLRADMLPFFTAKLVDAQEATDENVQGQGRRQMSGAVTDLTNHQTIKKVYHRFNTKFETFHPNYTEVQDVFQDGDVNTEANREYFSALFDTSLKNVIGVETSQINEAGQMYRLSDLIGEILKETSKFKMEMPSNSKPDMKVINRDTKTTIFIGESKSNEQLPPTPPSAQLSKQLLDHGFATVLATVTYEGEGEEDLNQAARNLRERLHVPLDNLQQKKIPIDRLSERARHILQIENTNDAELNGSYDGVIEAFEAGQINDENALHLWEATMQACVKSIELKMKYTMVLSNRVVWFIHLRDGNHNSNVNQEGGCGMIGISKGLAVGSKTFIRDFIQYAAMVERMADTENSEKDDWLKLVRNKNGGDRRHYRGGNGNEGDRGNEFPTVDETNEGDDDDDVCGAMDHEENKWKSNDGLDGSVKTEIISDIDTGSETCTSFPASSRRRKKRSGGGIPSSIDTLTEYILLDVNDHIQNGNEDCPHLKDEHDVCGSKKSETGDSHSSSNMTDQEQMRWQRVLWSPASRNAGTTKKDLRRGTSPTTAPTAGNSQLLKGAMIDAATTNDSYDANDNDNTAITDNGDDTSWSLTKAEQDALLDIDEYGFVPYIYQLTKVRCLLGYGRCGEVKKIKFFGIEVAMKEFKLPIDHDERDNYDAFEHEREMYTLTKSLWGTHVPALIFHNPWPSCPSLGIQVGEPMEDDIEKWSDDDKKKMNETLRKLEELGLEQTDIRGWNFVKLRNSDTEYVAVIDMESVYFIGKR